MSTAPNNIHDCVNASLTDEGIFLYIYLHLGKKAFKLIASSPVSQIDLRKSSLYQMVLFITSWKLQSSQIIHHLCGNPMIGQLALRADGF